MQRENIWYNATPERIFGSSGFCGETRSILIEYPQNSPKSLAQSAFYDSISKNYHTKSRRADTAIVLQILEPVPKQSLSPAILVIVAAFAAPKNREKIAWAAAIALARLPKALFPEEPLPVAPVLT
ncbi:hypothetical protein [Microcystis sp.]|jgi:hypothetical protein|uniref:hypothetical protein n=1 Tax=Microcystis sp. TaxID=1127 RepID=UPI00391A437F|nr:hypothetical protein [Microcystis aeruginosa LG13-13]NCR61419.1 hypothetical protein [Microcystis aeruginosa LG11-05]